MATTSEGARPSSGQDNAQQPLIDQVQALTQRIADLEGERQNVTAQKRALQLKHKNEMSQQRRDFESRIGQLKSQMSNVQLQLKNQTSINNRMAHSFAATTQDVATLREAKLNKVHFETLQKSFQDLYERVSGLETPIGTYLETEAVEAYDAYSPVMDDRDTLNDLMGYKNLCERLEGDFERFQEEKQRDDAHMEARATAQAAQINAQTAQINQQAAQINQQAAQINALMQMMAQVNLNLVSAHLARRGGTLSVESFH